MMRTVFTVYLWWLHVQHFGDPPLKDSVMSNILQACGTNAAARTDLHDEEMGVVDVEADGAEQVLHPGVVGVDSIDEVLIPTSNYHLSAGGKRKIMTVLVWPTSSQM